MRIRRTTGVFLSGCMVYGVMAACSGEVLTVGTGGASGHAGAGGDSGILDALTDPVHPVDAAPMSGSRLKKKYLLADDGTREDLPGWFDSQRQEDCAFGLAADGKTRCLPTSIVDAGGVFLDDQCTVALPNVAPACGSLPKYVRLPVDSNSCPVSYRFYTLAQKVTLQGPTPLFDLSMGKCVFENGAAQGTVIGYKLDAEIAPADLVGAAATVDP